jgi:hypothetical protein
VRASLGFAECAEASEAVTAKAATAMASTKRLDMLLPTVAQSV